MKIRVIIAFCAVVLAGAFLWQCGEGVTDTAEGDTGGDEERRQRKPARLPEKPSVFNQSCMTTAP